MSYSAQSYNSSHPTQTTRPSAGRFFGNPDQPPATQQNPPGAYIGSGYSPQPFIPPPPDSPSSSSASSRSFSSSNSGSSSENGGGRIQWFKRFLVDAFISGVCLGIPYIFLKRGSGEYLTEGRRHRLIVPFVLAGLLIALLSSVSLSVSITFLSYWDLKGAAHVTDLLAAVFATFSLSSMVFAILDFKSEMHRTNDNLHVGGFRMHIARGVVYSLPLIFLEYSIIFLVTTYIITSLTH